MSHYLVNLSPRLYFLPSDFHHICRGKSLSTIRSHRTRKHRMEKHQDRKQILPDLPALEEIFRTRNPIPPLEEIVKAVSILPPETSLYPS